MSDTTDTSRHMIFTVNLILLQDPKCQSTPWQHTATDLGTHCARTLFYCEVLLLCSFVSIRNTKAALFSLLFGNHLTGVLPSRVSEITSLYGPSTPLLAESVLVESFQQFSSVNGCKNSSWHIIFKVYLITCRNLHEAGLTGTIPAQMSMLVKLESLWALASFEFSVGLSNSAFLFGWVLTSTPDGSSASWHVIWIFFRQLGSNALAGTIPPQVSTLTRPSDLYVPK